MKVLKPACLLLLLHVQYSNAQHDIAVRTGNGMMQQLKPGFRVVKNWLFETISYYTDDPKVYQVTNLDRNYIADYDSVETRVYWTDPNTEGHHGMRLIQMEPMHAPPGSWFSEGRHCVQYGLVDGKGSLEASSVKQCFEVNVIRCPTLGKPDKIEYECEDKNIYQRGARYGSQCTFSCANGYELDGDILLTCKRDGTWDKPTPKCKKMRCDIPELPDNMDVSKYDNVEGNKICFVKCKEGYRFEDEDTKKLLTCGHGGRWNMDRLPNKCVKLQCGVPPVPANAYVLKCSDSYTYGSTCSFACKSGYELPQEGRQLGNYAFCGQTGTWVAQVHACKKLQCGEPPVPANAYVWKCSDSYYFESKCVFACNSGYELPPGERLLDNKAVCDETGTWVAQTQTCGSLEIQCPKLNRNEQCSDGYNVGSKCTQNCGRWLTSSTKSIECAHNGSWVGEFEPCSEHFSLILSTGLVAVVFSIGILVCHHRRNILAEQ